MQCPILRKFCLSFDFCGDRLLVAQRKLRYSLHTAAAWHTSSNLTILSDTLAMSRYVIPSLKLCLDALAKQLGIEEFEHHRATDDTRLR